MKLSIVIPILNQHEMCNAVISEIVKNSSSGVEIIALDNGSDIPFVHPGIITVRNEKSTGVYPTFQQGFDIAKGDVVAFFHSDFVVWEKDWDKRVIAEFEKDHSLGMIGFIGSNEIDQAGGRGLGTTSQFMGRYLEGIKYEDKLVNVWKGSEAFHHGKVSSGFSRAAVVDGCSMIIRRNAWESIGLKEGFPPHHFYDRLISTQLLEKNWNIGVLGIECDHFSGQTVNTQKSYQEMAYAWICENIKGMPWSNYDFNPNHNYDEDIYKIAESMWLIEYRDQKHIVPIKV